MKKEETLDPQNWEELRALGHEMVDDMVDYLSAVRSRPAWQRPPAQVQSKLMEALPEEPQAPSEVYRDFKELVLPYPKGNIHPRFWAWVDGTGTLSGAFADMLAATMNPNLGVADHSAIYIETLVINWCKAMLGYPKQASGILTSGASAANLTGLVVARNSIANLDVKGGGAGAAGKMLTFYGSQETHSSIKKAANILGLGMDSFRKVAVNDQLEIKIEALRAAIKKDRENGLIPFCIVGNVGTVNSGAIDPLDQIAQVAKEENLWFHIDGAFGALTALLAEFKTKLAGLNQADSIAFDFHKWLYVPYEAACLLVKDKSKHKKALTITADYLTTQTRGIAAGPEQLSDYSLQLSRGFRALKVWFSIKEHGIKKYERLIRQNIAQAKYLESLVEEHELLELLAPVPMNIVCYRFNPGNLNEESLNKLNQEILAELQERGIAVPSHTTLAGKFAIRMANTNHRSRREDFLILVSATVEIGQELSRVLEF